MNALDTLPVCSDFEMAEALLRFDVCRRKNDRQHLLMLAERYHDHAPFPRARCHDMVMQLARTIVADMAGPRPAQEQYAFMAHSLANLLLIHARRHQRRWRA